MKRLNHLYGKICSIENLQLADQVARKGKLKTYGVKVHDRNQADNIATLHSQLINKEFTTSPYSIFTVYEPKERVVYRLPYYPDRIVHHAVMNILEPVFVGHFTRDTYSCIKGRGIHKAVKNLKKALRDEGGTVYCLKLDVKKFYPSVDHDVLKAQLRRKFKDQDLLWLLDNIIDSAPGLPIGNYLSQFFGNFYLSPFDHWIKEELRVVHYFRYADDIVILANDKAYLHQLLALIKDYFSTKLKLTVKENYQVFPVDDRGIDILGYKFYHKYTLLRKRIKQSFARAVAKRNNTASIASYMGWAKHANTKHLVKTLLGK